MVEYFIKRPMLLCSIGCIIISVTGFYMPGLLIYILIFLSVLAGALIYKTKSKKPLFLTALIFIMTLSTLCTVNNITELSRCGSSSCEAELTVISTDYKCDDYYVSDVTVSKSEVLPKGTRLTVFYEPTNISAGSHIYADINIKKIEDSYSKADCFSRDIFLKGNIKNIRLIESKSNFMLYMAENIRNYIKTKLFGNMGYSEASTLCALIYGDKSYFSSDFYNNVKSSGVAHVMVVSGMHLSVIVSLTDILSKKLFYNRFIKAFLIISTTLFVSVLCGFTMSVLRAGFTYLIMAIGIMLDRKGKSNNTLGTALTTILIFSPFAIFSAALQLSALSTFGILAVALPVSDFIRKKELIANKRALNILDCVLMTLSASLLTLPVTICIFGYTSTVALFTNLLISLAVTADIYLVALALLLSALLPFWSELFFYPCQIVTKYINSVINFLGSLPFAVIKIPKIYAFLAVILIFTVMWVLLACKNRINMLKLEEIRTKIIKEGGRKVRWR